MSFRVNANKPNYILSRIPKIVYTEYDIDDEKEEENKNHKSVQSQKMQLSEPGNAVIAKEQDRVVAFLSGSLSHIRILLFLLKVKIKLNYTSWYWTHFPTLLKPPKL